MFSLEYRFLTRRLCSSQTTTARSIRRAHEPCFASMASTRSSPRLTPRGTMGPSRRARGSLSGMQPTTRIGRVMGITGPTRASAGPCTRPTFCVTRPMQARHRRRNSGPAVTTSVGTSDSLSQPGTNTSATSTRRCLMSRRARASWQRPSGRPWPPCASSIATCECAPNKHDHRGGELVRRIVARICL